MSDPDDNLPKSTAASGERDTLFAGSESPVEMFKFDENVVKVFDDMIHRSLPGYDAIVAMVGVLAGRYVTDRSNCYDLGCSLGEVTFSILQNIQDRNCNIIAVDNSQAMIDALQHRLIESKLESRVTACLEDIRDTKITNASFVVLNFVLQFLSPENRSTVLKKIYDGMLPGSILVLSEKIYFESEQENDFQIDMHQAFKKLQGYSDLEISRKRAALENVLVPDTEQTHIIRLQDTGFSQCFLWFQCFNFISIVAIK